jgi:hypothetical protein
VQLCEVEEHRRWLRYRHTYNADLRQVHSMYDHNLGSRYMRWLALRTFRDWRGERGRPSSTITSHGLLLCQAAWPTAVVVAALSASLGLSPDSGLGLIV